MERGQQFYVIEINQRCNNNLRKLNPMRGQLQVYGRQVSTGCSWRFSLWLIEFYVLATTKVPTYSIAHSWWLYSAAPLGDHAASTMTSYPIQSHYPDIEPTTPCPILIMLSACVRNDKYQFLSHWFDATNFPKLETDARLIRSSHLIQKLWRVCKLSKSLVTS